MRNEPKPLSIPECRVQERMTAILSPLVDTDTTVTLDYVKRDGNVSRSTGTVKFFNGRPGMDTGSVTVDDPSKGNRTINLHRIVQVNVN